MEIYKVFYFKRSGRNLIVSYSKSNYTKWGIDMPCRKGCCTVWSVHLGKLHIDSNTPINAQENG